MQQCPTNQPADKKRQHISAISVAISMFVPIQFFAFMDAAPFAATKEKHRPTLNLFLCLFLLGICLEGFYLALFPLLAGRVPENDPMFHAWHAFLPWLPQWNWTESLPAQLWSRLIGFDLATVAGNAGMLLVILCLILLGVLLAAQIGRIQWNMSLSAQRVCARLILVFAMLFGLTMLISPPHLDVFSRDMVSSWLAARMVVNYHVNPYLVAATAYPQDVATLLLSHLPPDVTSLSRSPVGTSGPVGIDISILISLFGQGQLANTLLGFRIVGLVLHLANALLIWSILRRGKPEMSLVGLVLYAWNPLFLLLGVAQMHQELVIVFFVLLAVYFLQRDASVLSWFFLLLAVLVNAICLLLLPIFLLMIVKKMRFAMLREQVLLWLILLVLLPIVFVLAYLPYWNGWGWNGLVTNLALVFFPLHPLNSFDAFLLDLPLSKTISTLLNPVYWSGALLGCIGLFLLFLFWLADTVEWFLLYVGWLLLFFFILHPLYWPWFLLLPLAVVLCSAHGRTLLLGIFLTIGAFFSYYCWSRGLTWKVQGILTIGLPCLVWGWCVFFMSTWKMTRAKEKVLAEASQQRALRPRPPWLSRPSWPSRQGKIRRPSI